MNLETRAAFERYLMAMADDELVIGYRDTEWTGVAPMLEEDIAFSSIGQDEVGHARLFYSLLHDLTGTQIDYRARRPDEYLHAQLVEHASAPRYAAEGEHGGGGDWAYALVRRYLYDLFDAERLESLRLTAWEPLASSVDKVRREEKYHLQHAQTWFDRLAGGGADGRSRLERALATIWPDAFGLFEPVEGEEALVAEGLLAVSSRDMRDRWFDRLAPVFARHGLSLPAQRGDDGWQPSVEPRLGGRQGRHTAAWGQMWDEMTSVYRLDPAAVW